MNVHVSTNDRVCDDSSHKMMHIKNSLTFRKYEEQNFLHFFFCHDTVVE